MTEIVGGYGV